MSATRSLMRATRGLSAQSNIAQSKQPVSACIMENVPTCAGEMAEWLKAHAWKACIP
jgi:hypothetical protein